MLSDEQRGKILDGIEVYIDKRFCYIADDLIDEIDGAEARMAAESLK